MKLIIDTINIDNLKNLDTIIFVVGITITFTFILFKIFIKEETAEENELDYYSRHNFPINEEKNVKDKNS
tara:strand:+ start:390 stop:599 length:210 start_codon:yes stop_codon:yes gene_type:complete